MLCNSWTEVLPLFSPWRVFASLSVFCLLFFVCCLSPPLRVPPGGLPALGWAPPPPPRVGLSAVLAPPPVGPGCVWGWGGGAWWGTIWLRHFLVVAIRATLISTRSEHLFGVESHLELHRSALVESHSELHSITLGAQ